MVVNAGVSGILEYLGGSFSKRVIEKYYRHKLKSPCFLMKQHDKWTIVTII